MKVLVLGSGQLARMMSLASAPLNIDIIAYDVNNKQIVHPLTQQVIDLSLEQAINDVDVITAEFEHIPYDILNTCSQSGKFQPNPNAIKAGGDRRLEKSLLDNAEVSNAKYHIINSKQDFLDAIDTVGIPMVLKSALGGYDGKGQWRLKDQSQIEQIWEEMNELIQSTPNQAMVAEQFIPFNREVSLIGARNENGELVTYPLTENVHVDGVLALSTALEGTSELQEQADRMFSAIADELDYIGVLAIEFFDVEGKLLVNEIAPRVHNSGHWTQQGTDVCQFEMHIRAVCNLPLIGSTLLRSTAMINILGEDTLPSELLTMPNCHIHWYGKEKRAGRKMGHINVCASSPEELQKELIKLSNLLDSEVFRALS
ncbi:5-(carboxyamino)imidazole ribonucleotide synthase [Aliivibrio sp. S3MY1]|uniref:5-(carboxyamino)imidazole ribonucleotide synthase n=1 Tax=unclassified Aliivibrio TaxID=2645654 RepID=UPI00237817DA|nr:MULTISPECIES: 5-(carboxyamino)imidazole ribonucleotide synthase [unclassified Aliivibrio]MDD9197439.1 5-(carboxyamino)imidazole ribonucleotide synthase [Aliivibrio sp. S3MY1]MDD9200296.1 5-(carboxyamino)imidazole ribonucleotide synthase [Aliivibrio sp. S2MY1]